VKLYHPLSLFMVPLVNLCFAGELTSNLLNDPMEQQLETMANQLSTLRANYTFEFNSVSRKVDLVYDITGDRFFGTTAFIGDPAEKKEKVHVHVRNDKTQWFSVPETGGERLGTWQVQVGNIDQSLPYIAYNSDAGMGYLRDMLVPFTCLALRKRLIAESLKNGGTCMIEQDSSNIRKTIRTYTFKEDGEIEYIVMEMDLSDGIRLLSTKQYCGQEGEKLVLCYETKQSEHKKNGDLWFPMKMSEMTYNPTNGQVVQDLRFEFESAECNIPLSEEEFVYTPPFGSIVYHLGSELTYRVGQMDPTSLATEDPASTDYLKAIQANINSEEKTIEKNSTTESPLQITNGNEPINDIAAISTEKYQDSENTDRNSSTHLPTKVAIMVSMLVLLCAFAFTFRRKG